MPRVSITSTASPPAPAPSAGAQGSPSPRTPLFTKATTPWHGQGPAASGKRLWGLLSLLGGYGTSRIEHYSLSMQALSRERTQTTPRQP